MTRNILITGAAHGLGRAIAQAADEQGYTVYALDIDAAGVQATVDTLTTGIPLVADVRDPAAVAAAVAQTDQIDALINNAGILRTGPLIDHDPEDFRLVTDINLNAVFIVAQAVARKMRDSGGGAIVNLASINGIHPSPNCGAYAAAKGGVMALTQQMSVEWGGMGIRVNAIAPGFIDAGMSAPFYADDAVRTRRGDAVPLGRLGTAEDVANTALYLVSDAAAYISGQTLAIDGGVINSVLLHLPRD